MRNGESEMKRNENDICCEEGMKTTN